MTVLNYLEGRFCILEPFDKKYFDDIYEIEMDIGRIKFFSDHPKLMSKERFIDNFYRKLQNYYHQYFIVKNKVHDKVIGYVYTYNLNISNKYVYISISSDETIESRCAIAEGGIIFINFLFKQYELNKIYADIYSFNVKSIKLVSTAGFIQEANLKQHKYYNNEYHSLLIYSLYKENFFNKNKYILNWKANESYSQ